MSRFKVGEKVLVKPNLKLHSCYNKCVFVREMLPFMGKVVTIVDVIDTGMRKSYDTIRYHIKEDYRVWFWSNDMLIPIPKNFINLKYYVPSVQTRKIC